MGTKEFLERYPEWKEIYENRKYIKVSGSKGKGQAYVHCRCSVCGEYPENSTDGWTRWQPGITSICSETGVYTCSKCVDHHEVVLRGKETLGVEGRKFAAKRNRENLGLERRKCAARKAMDTLGKEGLSKRSKDAIRTQLDNCTGFFSIDAIEKRYNTQMREGTFMRSKLEGYIDLEFGSQHSSPEFKYELDCYWPNLRLGVEVDDTSHFETVYPGDKQKRQGYHKEKDEYFRSLGITVLHLSLNPSGPRREGYSGWRDLVASFLDGTFEGPLIMLDDPLYGDIVY